MKVVVTCRQMKDSLPALSDEVAELGWEMIPVDYPGQAATTEMMLDAFPKADAAIVGDEQVTREIFEASRNLKALVKWGIGVDGIDFDAAKDCGVPVRNTPNMFGAEVADVALAYWIGLSRHLFEVDRRVRSGDWHKPVGTSLTGQVVAILGYGDIGSALAARAAVIGATAIAVDPSTEAQERASADGFQAVSCLEDVQTAGVVVAACPLTPATRNAINRSVMSRLQPPALVVNVSRGGVVKETDLVEALDAGEVGGAALDVFEVEPIRHSSELVHRSDVILGSHNGSNTREAALRASRQALRVLAAMPKERP